MTWLSSDSGTFFPFLFNKLLTYFVMFDSLKICFDWRVNTVI